MFSVFQSRVYALNSNHFVKSLSLGSLFNRGPWIAAPKSPCIYMSRSTICKKIQCGSIYHINCLLFRQNEEKDWGEVDKFLIDAPEERKSAPAATSKPKLGLNLPSAVFASKTEEKIGLLNKAAPSSGPLLDWDPDIVETLDDDFKSYDVVLTLQEGEEDVEDELDLLLAEANDEDGDEDGDDEEDGDSDEYGSEMDDDVPSLEGGFSFNGEETKSKFTSYSMSSSVIRRNNQVSCCTLRS